MGNYNYLLDRRWGSQNRTDHNTLVLLVSYTYIHWDMESDNNLCTLIKIDHNTLVYLSPNIYFHFYSLIIFFHNIVFVLILRIYILGHKDSYIDFRLLMDHLSHYSLVGIACNILVCSVLSIYMYRSREMCNSPHQLGQL